MTYRTIYIGGSNEFGEFEFFAVVPDHVTAEEVMFSPDDVEVFCECDTRENADLIVSLLNNRRLH